MFREAYAIASQFTWPVVLSRRTVAGKCSSTIGTFVVLNEDGWILTAYHIMEQFQSMMAEIGKVRSARATEAGIRADQSLAEKDRRRKLREVGKTRPDATERCSAWWGRDEPRLVAVHGIAAVDLALGRLQPFDPAWVTAYPVIKDPSRDFEPGVSLCKLGFPFHHIEPIWDASGDKFDLPAGALPLPRFPIEGILTRLVEVIDPAKQQQPPFPLRWVETSSPGLRGQSGGPTFDTKGTVWAIQARTLPLPLGFEPVVNGVKEHQFLNVGLGVHPDTIIGLLKQVGVKYNLSAY